MQWKSFFNCLALAALPIGAAAQTGNVLPRAIFFQVRDGLPHFSHALSETDSIHVVYLGGSITYNPGWRDKTDSFFRAQFPKSDFRFLAAGIPSLGSVPHAFRLQRDVLDKGRVDLLFIEAAVNDRVNGTDTVSQLRALEGIIRHTRQKYPECDIVMMAFADPDKSADYDRGVVPAEIANQERLASYYRLPSINMAREVHDRIAHHEFDWPNDFKDLHPSPFGQEIYFQTIKSLLERCFAKASAQRSSPAPAIKAMKPLTKYPIENGRYVPVIKAITDPGWSLVPDWHPPDSLPTRPGFVHIPVLESAQPKAAMTFSFTGDAVGIAVLSGRDAGMISYTIDDGPAKTKDLFTQWSGSLHLPWYLLLAAGLTDGKHILKLTVAAEKNPLSAGTACRIAHFLVDGK